ncbi:hypothetical protein [Epilithonimonas sp. UC225_85]|uniref:hypothetical protein n=1 Tax=Epilithonimonas sp. UC225_85 TaxID=3350167 RepID=UPI0036D2DBB9
MKNFFFFLIFAFTASFFNAQNIKKKITNNNEHFNGKIDNSESLKVLFESVSPENAKPETFKVSGYSDVEGTKADFEGTITFNPEKSKNFKDKSVKIYDFKLSEKGTGKHNGVFTGELTVKKSSEKQQLKFEGTWANYENTLKFPFYFNN